MLQIFCIQLNAATDFGDYKIQIDILFEELLLGDSIHFGNNHDCKNKICTFTNRILTCWRC